MQQNTIGFCSFDPRHEDVSRLHHFSSLGAPKVCVMERDFEMCSLSGRRLRSLTGGRLCNTCCKVDLFADRSTYQQSWANVMTHYVLHRSPYMRHRFPAGLLREHLDVRCVCSTDCVSNYSKLVEDQMTVRSLAVSTDDAGRACPKRRVVVR